MEDAMISRSNDSCQGNESQDVFSEQPQGMEDTQQEFAGKSYGINEWVQSAGLALQNECSELEKKIEIKTKNIQELKKKCATQEENIAKQHLDLEHLKVKSLSHFMNQNTVIEKNDFIRNKCETLQKNFSSWAKGINLMLPSKDKIQQVAAQMSRRTQHERTRCDQLEQEYKKCITDAKKILDDLSTMKENEENYFDQAVTHLKNEKRLVHEKRKELEEQEREVMGDCREQVISINILTPQHNQLSETLRNLKNELAAEMEKVATDKNQLEISLQNELKKTEEMTKNIEETEQEILKTSSLLCEKTIEIKEIDSNLKQLFNEGEELDKISKIDMEAVSKLQATAETMKEQLSLLVGISEENTILEQKYENLEKINAEKINELTDLQLTEECHLQKLEELNESINKMEAERIIVLNERLTIEDRLKELQKEMNDNANKHQKLSIEIDKPYVNLKQENDTLNASLDALTEQLAEASDNKWELKNVVSALKKELERARAISKENDYELFSFTEECKMIEIDQQSKLNMLNEMIDSTKQDYKKAESDVMLCDEIRSDLNDLKKELKIMTENNLIFLEELQQSQHKIIQLKTQETVDLRMQYEREFRNEEQSKLDDLVELKENKAEIEEIQKQKTLAKNEIRKTQSNVIKCDNLIRRLESKLNEVVHIAAGNSQSIASASGQSTNVRMEQLPAPRRTSGFIVASPGSDSSGLTFNPEEMDLKTTPRRPFGINRNFPVIKPLKTKEMPKKVPNQKKKEKELSPDEWGF